MTPLGIAIVGCGNIAGKYAEDSRTYPHLRLVAVTDVDAARAEAFAAVHGVRAPASLEDLLADSEVDIVVNLTVHQAHYAVTRQALEAGKHVYSEKPLALTTDESRELVDLAAARGVRLGCSPATFMGEAQQTAASVVRSGRLGTIRAVYADVNWGRIERWHPAPAPFYEVGVMVDVGVYPLTLVTAMLGPARAVQAWGFELEPERMTTSGETFRIGSPDLIVAAVELESGAVMRLTTSFWVGRPAKMVGAIEFHGEDGSLALESFQDFSAAVEAGDYGEEYEAIPPVRPPYKGTAWARGVADMAAAIQEGRPHRATGHQAAHVVEILNGVAESIRGGGRRIEIRSTFSAPQPMPWAADEAAEEATV